MRYLLAVVAVTLSLVGCSTLSVLSGQGGANTAQQGGARYNTMFVSVDHTWFCPSPDLARAAGECEGGKKMRKNRSVSVVESKEGADLFEKEVVANGVTKTLYVQSAHFSQRPDQSEMEAFVAETKERYENKRQIGLSQLDYINLVHSPKYYAGQTLIFSVTMRETKHVAYADGVMSFQIPIVSYKDAARMTGTMAKFAFANSDYVSAFKTGETGYFCSRQGSGYCDTVFVVAEVTGEYEELPNATGRLNKLPVIKVLALADRYGVFKSE